ncbi:unnamed protein product [Oikopleura dioica]|uniref:Uncharacterized protein n=1 Tax=Oikopleura dioica TaxID=34765 RepID=E4XCP1_OIKDI|nr:unnamed protein product [Oikopleura dioica]
MSFSEEHREPNLNITNNEVVEARDVFPPQRNDKPIDLISKTTVIDASTSQEDTLSTLDYSARAKTIWKNVLDTHAIVSRKGFEDLEIRVNEVLESIKENTEERVDEVKNASKSLLEKLIKSLEDFKNSHDKSLEKIQTINGTVGRSVESLNSEVAASLSAIEPELQKARETAAAFQSNMSQM